MGKSNNSIWKRGRVVPPPRLNNPCLRRRIIAIINERNNEKLSQHWKRKLDKNDCCGKLHGMVFRDPIKRMDWEKTLNWKLRGAVVWQRWRGSLVLGERQSYPITLLARCGDVCTLVASSYGERRRSPQTSRHKLSVSEGADIVAQSSPQKVLSRADMAARVIRGYGEYLLCITAATITTTTRSGRLLPINIMARD